jgi:alpha-galactosidase
MAFYLRFERHGEDLYPRLKEMAAADQFPTHERVRADVMRRFSYFVTESPEHFSEYTPWFIKKGRPDLIEHYRVPLDEYPARCEDQITDWSKMRAALLSDDPEAVSRYEAERRGKVSGMMQRRLNVIEKDDPAEAARLREVYVQDREERLSGHSGEYGTLIIHSMETGQPRVVYGNVANAGSIANLPAECAVEVPCLVDTNGVQPTQVGALPPQLAALMQTNINVQRLTVEAALTGKREHIYQAAMLEPHTAAELDLNQIASLVDELIAAHGDLLPAYH